MAEYKSLLSSTLPFLQEALSSPSSPTLTSNLLESRNEALRQAADTAFHTIPLSATPRPRPHTDIQVRAAGKAALQKAEALASITSSPFSSPHMEVEAKTVATLASSALRKAVRRSNLSSLKKPLTNPISSPNWSSLRQSPLLQSFILYQPPSATIDLH